MEERVSKPPELTGYASHRLVAGLAGQAQYVDNGDHLLIRREPTKSDAELGSIVGFTLKACVSVKVRGRHRYFPISDWRSRHEWLGRQGERNGFEVLTVHAEAGMQRIKSHDGRDFTVDATRFVGALKVTDLEKFNQALAKGIGNNAKAFGFGMLSL